MYRTLCLGTQHTLYIHVRIIYNVCTRLLLNPVFKIIQHNSTYTSTHIICTCIYIYIYMYMRISENHNSLGCEQPSRPRC